MKCAGMQRWARGWVGLLLLWSVGLRGAGFDTNKLAALDRAVEEAIAAGRCPGGVLWVEHAGASHVRAFGRRSVAPEPEGMTTNTIFDLASLTKVVAGTPALLRLVERGQVRLDAPVRDYLPEFTGAGRELVTVRQLLTHTSGLPPDIETRTDWQGRAAAVAKAAREELRHPPGTAFLYSDINLFLAGAIVERVTGRGLEEFVAAEIYRPLHMTDTGYLPPAEQRSRIAPTERDPAHTNEFFRGVVHDPTARHMGGVAGHAGLFSTAADLARFARMMLHEGELDGVRIFTPATVRLMTSVQTPPGLAARRGLGWDIDSPYSRPRGARFPLGSYGHTGFTGTCLWIDPYSKSFYIFLSNRVHPDGRGNVVPLYGTLGTLAAEAVADFDFGALTNALPAAETGVLNGIDVLARDHFAPLQGLRIGLITNPTGQDRERYSTIHLLRNAPGVKLVALFSPEHGLYGTADEAVGDGRDEVTGLPVYSLYGQRQAPTPEQLRGLNALVYDIQDIGCRFYTYPATLGHALAAAGQAGIKFVVLDRVNPINGVTLDGPVLAAKSTFVAYHPLPLRHGMTVGEMARMFNVERACGADLRVIPVAGWRRADYYDATGLPWRNPSPNMRSESEAILYPGVGLLERTAVSVGRGTGTPFEVVGAPYIEDRRLAAALNAAALPGVRFVPVRFTPVESVYKGQSCGGVNVVLTDREHCAVVDVGLELAKTLHRFYPEQFGVEKVDILLGHPATLAAVKADRPLAEIHALWAAERREFEVRRAKYLLY